MVEISRSPKYSRQRISCCLRPLDAAFFQLPDKVFSSTKSSISRAKSFFGLTEASVSDICGGKETATGGAANGSTTLGATLAAGDCLSSSWCSSRAAARISRYAFASASGCSGSVSTPRNLMPAKETSTSAILMSEKTVVETCGILSGCQGV